jgi:digeranylgeranylglycerophospholipid reductase
VELDFDVIVIGGSANGAQTARKIASKGKSVLIIEEHPNLGLPEHCSGLFSYSGLYQLDSVPPDEIVFNYDIYGSRLISPNGKTLTVKKKEKHALVCNRAAFDRYLLEKAQTNGAKLLSPFRVTKAEKINNGVSVFAESKSGEKKSFTCKILISAEGARATIAEQMGLSGPPREKQIFAAQFFMDNMKDLDDTLVEVYQSHEFAPDFFGWIIPMSKTSAKVGLGTSENAASKQLERMIEEHPVMKLRCEGATITRRIAGRIPPTGPVKRTYADNFLLVGDVAGQTKPTTGGGVILGGIAGQIAAEVVCDAIDINRLDEKYLKRYEKEWKKEMYRNLWLQRKVRNYMNRLSDEKMNHFFNVLEKKGILETIEKHGDVDNQGKLAVKLLKTFSLYPFYFKTSFTLLRAILTR